MTGFYFIDFLKIIRKSENQNPRVCAHHSRQIAHTHNFGIQPVVGNGVEHQLLSLELRIHILVLVDVLSQPEGLFRKLHVGTRHTVDAQSCYADSGDMNQARPCAQTIGNQVASPQQQRQ